MIVLSFWCILGFVDVLFLMVCYFLIMRCENVRWWIKLIKKGINLDIKLKRKIYLVKLRENERILKNGILNFWWGYKWGKGLGEVGCRF